MDQLTYKHEGQDGTNRAQAKEYPISSVVNIEVVFQIWGTRSQAEGSNPEIEEK